MTYACGEKIVYIDDTYGFDGVRLYEDICPTLGSSRFGLKVLCTAMRGRYKEDVSTEQRFEPRFDGVTNTITTVQKDNLIVEFE